MTEIAASTGGTATTMSHDGHDTIGARFHCRLCGEVIGVYEPLVAFTSSGSRTTSRAAEPELDPADTYYHRLCYLRRDERRG
jgi:hypothetical protein